MKRPTLKESSKSAEGDMDTQIADAVTDAIKSNDKTIEIRPADESKGLGISRLLLLLVGAIGLSYWLQKSQRPAEMIRETTSTVAERTKQATEQTSEKIEEGGEEVAHRIEEGSEKVEEGGEEVAHRIEEGSEKAGEKVEETGKKTSEKADKTGKKAAEKAEESDGISSK